MVTGTRTRTFGSSKREGHDSRSFYGRRLYADRENEHAPTLKENAVPKGVLDRILCQDSRRVQNIPDLSVHLMVTSPPYNVGKVYDKDLNLSEYRDLLKDVFSETHRVLVNGGRACVNVANVGRKPYLPYHKHVIDVMEAVGFKMRGEILWVKGAGVGTSTAWGSWRSPANPTLRDVHEYILVFSKGRFGRDGNGRKSTITRNEFLEYTKSVWYLAPESARRVGHPAPFPVDLPLRLIQLYSYAGDVVLDPFCGVGTTCLAALRSGRHFVGFDSSKEYVRMARSRLREEVGQGVLASTGHP